MLFLPQGSQEQMAWYDELQRRSVADVAWFWDAVVQDLELEWFQPYSQVVDISHGIEWPRWFVGGRYNYVRDAVDKQALRLRPHATAIAWEGEDGEVRTLTYAELYRQVNQAANTLKLPDSAPLAQLNLLQNQYQSTSGRLQDLDVQQTRLISGLTIAQLAMPPTRPADPDP